VRRRVLPSPHAISRQPTRLQDTQLLGGRVGRRVPLESVVYDYFVSRFGARPSAELHLAAFIRSVMDMRCGKSL
jgi:hypothetical protein